MAARKNKAPKKTSSRVTGKGSAHQFGFASEDETQLAALVWKLGAAKARVIVDHVERIKVALRG